MLLTDNKEEHKNENDDAQQTEKYEACLLNQQGHKQFKVNLTTS